MRVTPLTSSGTARVSAADAIPGPPSSLRRVAQATPQDEAFVGREHELGVLDALLAQVRADGARVALVRGAPGIGKTALVRTFLRRHGDLTVAWGSGDEGEATVSYALVDQLFAAMGLRGASLLAHTERVLPIEEPIVVGRQILAALTRCSAARPVVVVVDDAHWADVDSLRAVLFVLRRLATHPVLTILVVPPDDTRLPAGLERLAEGRTGVTLQVGPLVPGDVQALAAATTGTRMPGMTAHRLCAHTLGNPRHVLALLAETPPDRWRGWDPVLPAPRVYSRTVGRRLAACSDRARRLVEAAAVVGDGATLAIAAALAEVDEPLHGVGGGMRRRTARRIRVLSCRELGVRAPPRAGGGVRAADTGPTAPAAPRGCAARRRRARGTPSPCGGHPASGRRAGGRVAVLLRPCEGGGEWREAAWALLESGRLSGRRAQRERRLLRAVGFWATLVRSPT